MNMLRTAIGQFVGKLAFRSMRAQGRWQSFRDLVLLILSNSDSDHRPPPRRPTARE